jgi:uncharacterized protein
MKATIKRTGRSAMGAVMGVAAALGVGMAAGLTAVAVWAQTGAAKPAAVSNAPAAGSTTTAAGGAGAAAAGIPMGTGAGVHGANSPFAPIKERADVLPWSVLTEVKTKTEKNRILPVYPASIQALNQKTQRIQGFMMPLEPGEKQKHFLLSSVPLTCGFCVPGGPESMVEVKTKTPVAYSMDVVVVEGRFNVLNDDPYGLYYRIVDAVPVK